MIYGKAQHQDTQCVTPPRMACVGSSVLCFCRHLVTKLQDEIKALQLCQNKVRQKKLPMEVIDAEYQWYDMISVFFCRGWLTMRAIRDQRKLTFYFVAEKHIDFRELVRELFRCVFTCAFGAHLILCVGYTRRAFGWPLSRVPVVMNSN